MEEEKRTFYEWNDSDEFDFKVLDPDGFPRHDVVAMQGTRYTRDEFIERSMRSTIQPLSDLQREARRRGAEKIASEFKARKEG